MRVILQLAEYYIFIHIKEVLLYMFKLLKKVFSSTQDNDTVEETIDFTTIEGITSIAPKNYYIKVNGNPLYYFLQRQATQYKKSGNMDLAIACLRKSNEISDTYDRPPLLDKDYLRLPKYIKLTGNDKLAAFEEQQIRNRHPEFLDKRVSNKKRILETINQCKQYNNANVYIITSSICPYCSKYNRKIYSVGNSQKYPRLPEEFILYGGFCPDCIVGISIHHDS